MINYKTFTELYNEAKEYLDYNYFVGERGWQEWMNPFENEIEKIEKILETIYDYARKSLKDIRESSDISRAEFARIYNIPIRTVENWDVKNNLPEYTETLIKYTLFLEEMKNEDIEE